MENKRKSWNSGKKGCFSENTLNQMSSHRKDKDFDEIYGEEKSQKIRNKMSESSKGQPSEKKGKTFIEMYGEEKANKLKEGTTKRAEEKRLKKESENTNFKIVNGVKIILCDYGCGLKANYRLKNKKWCCSDSHNKCPGIRKKNSKSNMGRDMSYLSGENHPSHRPEVQEKRKETCLKKYGVTSPLKSPIIMDKVKETNLEKYGTEYACQSELVKDKIKETCLEKYGVENPGQSPEIIEKIKETKQINNELNPNRQNEINDKIKETSLERFGETNYFKTEEFQEKKKETCLEKFGVEHQMQSDEIKNKMKEAYSEKYGVEWNFQRPEFIVSISGPNNINWTGGSSDPYCEIFSIKEFHDMIKERDNFKCQNPLCNSKNPNDLCIHHIDYNKMYCHPRNLITVCRSCNARANSKRDFWEDHYKVLMESLYENGIHLREIKRND